ncbi:zinc finger MYM-type protein 1-like [Tachypleus tridentatus]|uniref:zinc finger MYM-type protein 1-like n=1 Tax=Tachypleus tridentatus TaxID=6853 RepID=UPI003FD69CA6
MQQEECKRSLAKVFRSLRFLLRQGSALRGHFDTKGNFLQLMKLLEEEDSELTAYLSKKNTFTSPQAQNEIMEMSSYQILMNIAHEVQQSKIFALMVDGTQDVTGAEEEAICVRYVDENLDVHEIFLGLYSVSNTTGETISSTILDVLTRLNLPLSGLRAQTYDGAATMSGAYSGCQAKITEKQPSALFFHCGAHKVNLIMQHADEACECVQDSIQWEHELGVLLQRSGKYKTIFENIVSSDSHIVPVEYIRPLCPTHWLCRLSAIACANDHYSDIVDSLYELANEKSDVAVKARGLLDRFDKGKSILGLLMAQHSLAALEELNRAFQVKSATVSGMIEASAMTVEQLRVLRREENYKIFDKAEKKVTSLDLVPVELPRIRRPSRSITGIGSAHHSATARDYYRSQYFEFVDTVIEHLTTRFNADNNDLRQYLALENMITSGKIDNSVINFYPEISAQRLEFQLPMFKGTTKAVSLKGAKDAYCKMNETSQQMFSEVFLLMKILLECLVSSCECERSFSALRRLKTW